MIIIQEIYFISDFIHFKNILELLFEIGSLFKKGILELYLALKKSENIYADISFG